MPFVRQTLTVLEQNPDIVPPALGLPEAQADLVAMNRLRPVLSRLQRLTERVSDSEMALGSDLMNTALEGYGLCSRSPAATAAWEAPPKPWAPASPAAAPARAPRPRSDVLAPRAGSARSWQCTFSKAPFAGPFC